MDTLIHPGWIIPAVPEGDVLTGFSIALHDDKIVAIAPTEETTHITARHTYTLPEHALIPGLINAHVFLDSPIGAIWFLLRRGLLEMSS